MLPVFFANVNPIVHHAVLKFSCNKPLPQLVLIVEWYWMHGLLRGRGSMAMQIITALTNSNNTSDQQHLQSVFTARCYASTVLAMVHSEVYLNKYVVSSVVLYTRLP